MRVKLKTMDTMLTTNMRLNAEPAPEVRPGQMGVLLTGNSGSAPEQIDNDEFTEALIEGIGLLSPAQLAKVKAVLFRFGNAGTARMTAAGIATSDVAGWARPVEDDAMREAHAALDAVRQNCEQIAGIASANRDFWDKRNAAEELRMFGR